ncbi:MAG: radical SAM protein [Ardenticatenaceae bacterium]|nr:radical SAM protein [Ardenticatenaceae bacterium]
MADLLSKPYLTISLTDVCNLRCVYCPPAGENYHTPTTMMNPEQACAILDTAVALGVHKVRFTGGEPLLYPHLATVMRHAATCNLEVHINTNGLLLAQNLAWLKTIPNLFVKVSLDAHTNAAMRRIAGAGQAKRVIEGLRQAAVTGIVQRVNFVLTQLNVDEVPGILALCRELGIGLKIFDMFPVPETAVLWQTLYAPIEAINLDGEPAPPYAYTRQYGTPTRELIVDGVHVRIKNCQDGTRYHTVCQQCPFFPCPEGLYCLLVTPSLTVVPCRLGEHLYRHCHDFAELRQAIAQAIQLYQESYFANLFHETHQDFYAASLNHCPQAEFEGVRC